MADNAADSQADNKSISRITNLGIGLNLALAALKITVGFFAGSIALIADGLHSLTDLVTDFAVLIGVFLGARKADPKHPYGHGRAETFSTAIIASALIVVGLFMIFTAGKNITQEEVAHPGIWAVSAAIISIIAKEWLYRKTKKVAVKTHSSALYANAWHHRTDALSSVAVVVGLVTILLGFRYGDQLAAIAVGLMIVLVGWRVLSESFQEFSEAAVDIETMEKVQMIVSMNPEVRQWHKLRSRSVGREIFLDIHILVDPNINVTKAHEITENVQNSLQQDIQRPVNIVIHVEPDLPEFRKSS